MFNGQSFICAAGGAPKVTHERARRGAVDAGARDAEDADAGTPTVPSATTPPSAPVLKAATLDPAAPTAFAIRASRSVALPIVCPSSVTCAVRGSVSTTAGALLGRPDVTRKARHYAFKLTGLSVAAGGKHTAKAKLSASFLRSARGITSRASTRS